MRTLKELLHELQVTHWKCKNEKLRLAYATLEKSRNRYKNLYPIAPLFT